MEVNPAVQRKIDKQGNPRWSKVIQDGEFNVKESQRYNVSVLMNHYQDKEYPIPDGCLIKYKKKEEIYIYIYIYRERERERKKGVIV